MTVVFAEGEPISKKPKRPPAEHLSLDLEAKVTKPSSYIHNLLAPSHELPISIADLQEFLSGKSGRLPVLHPDTYMSVNGPNLVKLYSPVEMQVAALVEAV